MFTCEQPSLQEQTLPIINFVLVEWREQYFISWLNTIIFQFCYIKRYPLE